MIRVLVVNINGLQYTKDLVGDLLRQTHPYWLRLIDQGSSEEGTKEFLEEIKITNPHIEVIMNSKNVPLNWLWNKFYEESGSDYLCFLNNDIRLPSNFIKDTVDIFEEERDVGCVLHATNHPDIKKVVPLEYVVMNEEIVQGWAFTMRREVFIPIPKQLKVFGGDDWLFAKMYDEGWSVAMCLSSPIIHYYGKSRGNYKGDRNEELSCLKELGIGRLPYRSKYTKQFPTFDKIKE